MPAAREYRGRVAPSPTGFLHLGHARTFWIAHERARSANGVLIYRNEDLDPQRSTPEFAAAALEDLRWLGLEWQEGPDVGGRFAPYDQSARREMHRTTLLALITSGHVFACTCSRKDIAAASQAPHGADDEPVYPGTCRHRCLINDPQAAARLEATAWGLAPGTKFSLRLRTSDGALVRFADTALGPQSFEAGRDFGDYVLWRHDDVPSYQLAVVADDIAMRITEVVRGEDLLVSTARQLLLYEKLRAPAPAFHHCTLVRDDHGQRLAKRSESLSLRALREAGRTPNEVRAMWAAVNGDA
ncbi:MAG TPA: tRNA glutamyl-Q(34) synthetase GluQRS [Verrucomicrobiales bacterium]|nr:tRNA glutamyl-Q(34) synthetase GluQRS [Verrucomicrobiales bacterium]